jgi:hypothetical protein
MKPSILGAHRRVRTEQLSSTTEGMQVLGVHMIRQQADEHMRVIKLGLQGDSVDEKSPVQY